MRKFILWVALALVAAGARADASVFEGTVRDTNGNPGQGLSGIPVLVWQHGGGWQQTVPSGPDGHWECVAPDGFEYNLACNKSDQSGFQSAYETIETDNVALSQDTIVNFDLPPPVQGLIDAELAARGGASVVGTPYDNGGGVPVHRWGSGWIQDFRGGSGGTGAILTDGRGSAFWVHGGAWDTYLRAGGAPGPMGLPTSEAQGGKQTFEHGWLEEDPKTRVWHVHGVFVPPPSLRRVGIDGNKIFHDDGSQAIDVGALAALGAKVVRVNFISGPWSGPADTSGHAGRTWAQATNQVVNELHGAGIGVYGLLNDELIGGAGDLLRDQTNPAAARDWIEKFAAACERAVGELKDRVTVFEVMNEPNDWAGGTNARVQAHWQALVLRRVYERVKLAHATDPSWQVTLLAGPEFSSVQTLGDGYLEEVYREGVAHQGWDGLLRSSGTYPLDGVAYHIYELQDPADSPARVGAVFGAHLDAIQAVLTAEDPGWASKKIWVSEFGWQSSSGGEQHQADMLQAGFDALLGDSRVAVAIDFCAFDFPGKTWGMVGKKAAFTFQANAGR